MIWPVSNVLESFDQLSEPDRHEAAVEILRRSADVGPPPLSAEAFAELAFTTFREIDEREADDESP